MGRHADDGGARLGELVLLGRKGVCLEITATRVRGRIEIDHHRTLRERLLQRKGESLPAWLAVAVKSGAAAPAFNAATPGVAINAAVTAATRAPTIRLFIVPSE